MSDLTMTIIAGAILLLPAIAIIIVRLLPSRTHDPQAGMAIGCLNIILIALLVILAILLLAYFTGLPLLIRIVFYPVAIAAVWVLIAGSANFIVVTKRKRRFKKSQPPS
jgi:MFS family permease